MFGLLGQNKHVSVFSIWTNTSTYRKKYDSDCDW